MSQAENKDSMRGKVFIFAGEKSGDLHGSHLIQAMRKQRPSLNADGIAGPRMRACGIQGPLQMENFEVMGLTDVLLALPKLFSQFYTVRDYILKTNPEVAILIDSPSFTLPLAKSLRRKGYQGKIVQYVSPSVWAGRRHRIEVMEKSFDLLMMIYPFESACYKDSSLSVTFVGNPLKEYIAAYKYDDLWKEKIRIPSDVPLIALFPGSRKGEIIRNLPLMLDAVDALLTQMPKTVCGISCGHVETASIVAKLLSKYPPEKHKKFFLIPKEFSYELMRDSRCAIAKSGTVTLELVLHNCPTIVMYALTRLNKLYAKYILKLNLPYYCIVNILAGGEVFPEFIEKAPNKDNLLKALHELFTESPRRSDIIESCITIARSLGDADASQKAAHAIERMFSC